MGEASVRQTVEFEKDRFAHGVWLITPEVCLHDVLLLVVTRRGGGTSDLLSFD